MECKAILSVKLKYLKEWTNKRIKAAETYTKSLEGGFTKSYENARHAL